MNNIPDNSIDMVCCDLPYGITHNKADIKISFEPLWEQYWRVCKENAAIVLFAAQPFTSELVLSQKKWYRYDLIWEKNVPTGFLNAKVMPLRSHEHMLVFYKRKPTYNPQITSGHRNLIKGSNASKESINYKPFLKEGYIYAPGDKRLPRSVIKIDVPRLNKERVNHPTQKPLALLQWLIKTYSNPGETVLDNTMGSGSTGVAAIKENRNFIGIELNQTYFELAKKRIENENVGIESFFDSE